MIADLLLLSPWLDRSGALGIADMAIGFQPPAGAGIAVDAAGVVASGAC